jgi:glucose/arabinose dehydrogenase
MPLRGAAGMAALAALACAAACNSSTDGNGTPTPTPTASANCSSAAPVAGEPPLRLVLAASGFEQPVDLQSPPGDCRMFVVEQAGRIKIVRSGSVVGAPFLDIASRVLSGGERGLLGLAFHPRYAENGRFFVHYTDGGGDHQISEFHGSGDAADAASERKLLFLDDPFANHNGGGLAFGNDGFLYIGLGDGGSGGDPLNSGQRLDTLLGKMLRIDVDSGSPYGIPPGNPFTSTAGARPEIWAYGLRNPWRFAFDRATGDLLIGDVGQNRVEEIDLGLGSGGGGENYGWRVMEGSTCFQPASGCNRAGLTLPIVEFPHPEGCSVTGGVVYRGRRLPGYQGLYFYSDYCASFIRSIRVQNGAAVDERDWTGSLGVTLQSVSSFGVDAEGEVYVVDHDGEVYRLEPAS